MGFSIGKMFSIFTIVKMEDTSKDGEVKARDRIAAVDAIFPSVSCSDIISKQYGGRRVGLQRSNCDSFAKMS